MVTSQNLKTITDMRKDADGLLKLAEKTKSPIGILKNNKLKAYIIDAKTLEKLEQVLEDYEDSQLVEKRFTNAKPKDFVKLDDYLD